MTTEHLSAERGSKLFPVLTVYEPWASLIAYSFKEFETRRWSAPKKYHGQIMMIHAGKQWGAREKNALAVYKRMFPEIADMPISLGCIVAACRLVEVVPSELLVASISRRERAMGGYEPGRYGWRFEVVKRLEHPVDVRGQQGLWNWTPERSLS